MSSRLSNAKTELLQPATKIFPKHMATHLHLTSSIAVPVSEISFRFSRSGGRGGQNVNKVESKAELLFDLDASTALSPEVRERLKSKLASRLVGGNVLSIVVDTSRSQWENREIAIERFVTIMRGALAVQKKRTATKPTRASKTRRVESKQRRGTVKKGRGKVRGEE
jgi:ribosome-associated protein